MTTAELAQKCGETPKAVLDAIRRGDLKAEKVEDPHAINGVRWNVTTPLDEAKTIMANRVRRKTRAEGRTPSRRVGPAPTQLPASKDLFKPEEAARAAGINVTTMYRWIKENHIQTLRNGRHAYIPRNVVERLRENFVKPAVVPLTVVAPSVIKPDPRIDRLEKELAAVYGFLTRFAKSCGYTEGE